jgi:hypothetical protein
MSLCKQCGEEVQTKGRRGAHCCFKCSPFKGKREKDRDHAEHEIPNNLLCLKCLTTQPKSDFYRYPNNVPHQWCKTCVKAKALCSQHRFKLEAIAYKGGVCVECEKMPHPASMEFHHLDPSGKDFSISNSRTKTLNEKVKEELDKCILVCRNCHGILHAEGWTDSEWSPVM